MTRLAVSAGFAVLLTLVLGAGEQDAPQARKFSNVKWYNITHVDYVLDKEKEALEIVFDHFVPAARAAGLEEVRLFEYATGGEWDLTMFFPLKEGPAGLEWEMSPDSVKWRSALAKQEGGMEQAKELLARYHSMVNRYESQIVRERLERTKLTEATR